MKLTRFTKIWFRFGGILDGFPAALKLPKKGSSVELPSNFQFATTKYAQYE